MFLIVHVLLGAVIGIYFNSIWVIVVLAFVTHFLLDMIPHWDNNFDHKTFRKKFTFDLTNQLIFLALVDFLVAFYIGDTLLNKFARDPLVLAGMIAAIAPDFIKVGYFTGLSKLRWFKKYIIFHSKIQKEVNWKTGLLTQIITAIILLSLFP